MERLTCDDLSIAGSDTLSHQRAYISERNVTIQVDPMIIWRAESHLPHLVLVNEPQNP